MALILGASANTRWETGLTALVLLGFILVRQLLMPLINRARDADIAGETGAAHRFKRLHRTRVVINSVQ